MTNLTTASEILAAAVAAKPARKLAVGCSCPECEGEGSYEVSPNGDPQDAVPVECEKCHGDGKVHVCVGCGRRHEDLFDCDGDPCCEKCARTAGGFFVCAQMGGVWEGTGLLVDGDTLSPEGATEYAVWLNEKAG